MKAFTSIAAALAAGCMIIAGGAAPVAAHAEEELAPACKSAYLVDYDSGTAVYTKNEEERLPIASMCKIMTLLLSFEAADRGELSYDELICVSENAAGMGGSQVFLDANLEYPAEQLMKSIAVCSANDSCVAMAERVAGSETTFVERMNARAKELGAENTLFANCTGLPKETQYSCAKDVSLMLRELLKHKKYYEFSRVWLEDFAHPDGRTTEMTNTNKLVRFYNGCDGGKTGFTNEAGFCLAATAKRGDMRLVSVVIGSESSKARFGAVSSMFDYGFANYETKTVLEAGKELEEKASVRGSRVSELGVVAASPLTAFGKKGTAGDYTLSIEIRDDLKAPVVMHEEVGSATLFLNGVEIGKTALLANGDAPKFTWWDAYRESAQNWN